MVYNRCENSNQIVTIEDMDSDNPYTEIASKAFLSKKEITQLTLSPGITKIGQWAFAHMKNLSTIIIPANDIELGKDVFLDCSSLKEVRLYPDESGNSGLSLFLAACIRVLKTQELLRFKEAASFEGHKNWIREYDSLMLDYIEAEDDKGFEPVLYGWFNDEGEDDQKIKYINSSRYNKVSLAFLRLEYNSYLDEDTKTVLLSYISDHFPGGAKEGEHIAAYQYVLDKGGNDISLIKIIDEAKALKAENIDMLVNAFTSSGGNPEVISYLMTKSIEVKSDNAFDRLIL